MEVSILHVVKVDVRMWKGVPWHPSSLTRSRQVAMYTGSQDFRSVMHVDGCTLVLNMREEARTCWQQVLA